MVQFVLDAQAMLEFVKFLKMSKYVNNIHLTSAEISLSNMKRNLKARIGPDKSRAVDSDSKVIVTGRDLENFYSSARCTAAQDLLNNSTVKTKKRDICNLRNYLISSIIIDNYCRPCSLYSMSVTSLMEAKVSVFATYSVCLVDDGTEVGINE